MSVLLPRLHLLLICLTLLALPFASIPTVTTDNTLLDSKIFAGWMLLGLTAACGMLPLLQRLAGRDLQPQLQWFDLSWLGLILISLYSSVASDQPRVALQTGLPFWLLCLIGYQLQLRHVDRAALRKITGMMLLAGCAIGLEMLLNFYGVRPLGFLFPYTPDQLKERGIFVSVIGNPEYSACFLAPLAMFCFAGGAFAASARRRFSWCIPAVFLTGCTLLTQTRAIVLGFAGAGGFILLAAAIGRSSSRTPRRGQLPLMLLSFILAAGATLALFSTDNPLNPARRVDAWKRLRSVLRLEETLYDFRLPQLIVGAELFGGNPLAGGGAGCVERRYFETLGALAARPAGAALRAFTHQHPEYLLKNLHNDWLELMVEHGALGLFCFLLTLLLLLGGALRRIAQRARGAETADLPVLEIQLGGALICYLGFFLTSFPLHTPVRQCYFWMLFAALANLIRTPDAPPQWTASGRTPPRSGLPRLQGPYAPFPGRTALSALVLTLAATAAAFGLKKSGGALLEKYLEHQSAAAPRLNFHFYKALESFQPALEEHFRQGGRGASAAGVRDSANWNAARAGLEWVRLFSRRERQYLLVNKAIAALEAMAAANGAGAVPAAAMGYLSHYWRSIPPAEAAAAPVLADAYQQMFRELEQEQGPAEILDQSPWARIYAAFPDATKPSPANRGRDVALNVAFSWSPAVNAERYEFYLWKSGEERPRKPRAQLTGTSLSRRLRPGTVYFWQVVAVGQYNREAGELWCFRTRDGEY